MPECGFTAPDDTLEFDEWVVDEIPYAPGEAITVSDNVTVKAVWKKITYYITITDKNGNKVQITPSNCQDVLGDGTVSYTPPIVDSTRTYTNEEIEKAILGEPVEGIQLAVLTLKNADLQQIRFDRVEWPSNTDSAARVIANLFSVPQLKLEGDSAITNDTGAGIIVYSGMIITGDGSLTVNAKNSNAIGYGVGGLYLQQSGTVTLNAYSRGIYQGEPINILFWGGKLTIQAGNQEDESSGAIALFDGFSMADNAALWLGDSAETNCIPITPPNDDENWRDAILRQWRAVGSENNKPHYLQLTSAFSVTLNAGGGTINSGNVTGYTYGEGATLPTADDMTYTGYTFKGWYDNEALTGTPITAISNTEAGDKEYWAKWEVNQYTVTVKPENGKADITITQDYGTPITAPTLTREGYQFNGWDKTFPTTMPDEDMTITAQWLDVAAPTGEIKIAENGWKTFLNSITFGLFFKDTQMVTITATDNSGETVTVEYLLSDKELTETELANKTFTPHIPHRFISIPTTSMSFMAN